MRNVLGDGTKRIYKKVQELPALLLGEELTPLMAAQLIEPNYFLLIQETLPSGNQLFFSYDAKGHLSSIEMKNKSCDKTLSWIRLSYDFQEAGCQVRIQTSDARSITYHLTLVQGIYNLTKVEGSHCMPISYEYGEALVKKILPEGRLIEVEYQNGKVISLKGPNALSGKAEIVHSFSYEKDFTDVFNAMGIKTRYRYDSRFQLTAIERYDDQNSLYRIEHKFWGKQRLDAGLLLAKTIGDHAGRIYSHRSYSYETQGNVS
jgi:YD repeat-containing protein